MHIVKRRDRAQTQAQIMAQTLLGPAPRSPAPSPLVTRFQAGHLEARPSMPSTTYPYNQQTWPEMFSLFLFSCSFLACFGLLTALCFRVIVLTAVLVYVSLAPEFLFSGERSPLHMFESRVSGFVI